MFALTYDYPNGIYRINGGSAILTGYAMLENENTSVYLPETVEGKPLTGIAPRAFAGTNVGTVFIPATVTEIELGAFADSDLSRINVDSNNPVYSSLNGVLYSKDGSQLLACPPMLYTLSIPEGVTAIASYAFDGAALREITLPENICTIDERAFRNTEISELRLPAGVENIGTRAFTDCKNLARVEAVGSPDVIGDYAFAGCDPFLLVYGPDEDCALKQAAASVNAYYNAYTLTIYEDGAERSLLLPAGTSLLLPEKPTVGENRQFTGWYLEESFETRFTETTMPAHDLGKH